MVLKSGGTKIFREAMRPSLLSILVWCKTQQLNETGKGGVPITLIR
jgi:hypothetical protein